MSTPKSLQAIALPTIMILSPIIYLSYKRRSLIKSGISITTNLDIPAPPEDIIKTIPQKLKDYPSEYLISHETASKTIPLDRLADQALLNVLIKYLRANMHSFTYTPQSPLLKSMIKSSSGKESFSPTYLSKLDFNEGDLVCGVFRVSCKGEAEDEARIELALDPDESFTGPRGEGRLVSRIVRRGSDVIFINGELIMLRFDLGTDDDT